MLFINEDILKKTIKYQFDFACLKENGFPKCMTDYSFKNS